MVKYPLTFVLLVFVVTVFAVNPESGQPTLSQQFQDVREQAEVIGSFRMLKAYQVENLWKSVEDTLRSKDEAYAAINNQVSIREGEIKTLQATIDQKEASVEEMEFAGSHITVLGWDVSKSSFTTAVFITVISLLVLMGLSLAAFKMSYGNARESKSLYDEVYLEFETYKHKMVEKEVKLLRELQDYRNQVSELKSA